MIAKIIVTKDYELNYKDKIRFEKQFGDGLWSLLRAPNDPDQLHEFIQENISGESLLVFYSKCMSTTILHLLMKLIRVKTIWEIINDYNCTTIDFPDLNVGKIIIL